MKKVLVILAFLSTAFTFGCATIMHGTMQDVAVSSNPSYAKVFIDNEEVGLTPVTTSLKRKEVHNIRIELDGYHPYQTTLNKKTSGWVAGNILLGGLIGFAVDAISGGIYDLTPEQVQAELKDQNNRTSYKKDNDVIFFTVTLEPNEEWVKIGQMQKIL